MSVRKSSHGTIFLIVSSGSPRALIASSLRSTSKKPFCPMTRSLHPPMTACGHRVRFVATWREEFFEVPIELGSADHETDVLEQAADLVLEITLDLDQQCSARQQSPNRMAIEVLDAHLLKPAGLHDAGAAGRVVAVTLIGLHLDYGPGMSCVDTEHRHP